jgi:glutamate synthase domain-containing protein 2
MKFRLVRLPASTLILMFFVAVNLGILVVGLILTSRWYWAFLLTIPATIAVLRDMFQVKKAVLRNFPLIGRLRYLFESIRPELRQYFFESDLDGRPFSRRQRSIVYQRAKNEKQTVAFGMQADPNAPGYEWVAHSIYPVALSDETLHVKIGNAQCTQPYNASIYNIGAMSYGALSKTAISSLNQGAALGGFAHNTGEGGISEHHLQGGDLIWQIGTGYFGCRDEQGYFSAEAFGRNALRPQVKMIELKLSQGAKPGHGGLLPAAKNTPEIALIRGIEPYTTVHSPARHSAFSNAGELMYLLKKLRHLSGGKPVGFKLCIGDKAEFIELIEAVVESGIEPDFITIDGAEGGTGAAPLEFTDHIGMPLHQALVFARSVLISYQLEDSIRLVAAGKIITGFDILKAIALGASACYSARGMMLALGCIQALKCDSGHCPVGVATQDPNLYKGLVPSQKKVRVASFHRNTMQSVKEIMESCGFRSIEKVDPAKFFRKGIDDDFKGFDEIYFNNKQNSGKSSISPALN